MKKRQCQTIFLVAVTGVAMTLWANFFQQQHHYELARTEHEVLQSIDPDDLARITVSRLSIAG